MCSYDGFLPAQVFEEASFTFEISTSSPLITLSFTFIYPQYMRGDLFSLFEAKISFTAHFPSENANLPLHHLSLHVAAETIIYAYFIPDVMALNFKLVKILSYCQVVGKDRTC